ncbi:MAG TPA: permease-like cell division protein FtsX [Burkholderiales bacterium]|nr:permease-like cell division protein FtsX [Burkholderiales bacterium]
MRAWLRQHREALARAARRVGVLNTLVIGVALALPAGGYALLESLRALTGRLSLEPQISLFLDAKRTDVDALAARIKRDTRVRGLRFVPREEALREIGGVQGVPELVEALGRNPLPDGFVISTANESVEPLAAELAKLPGVAHVQADALWARRLASLARVARAALWLLAGLLGAALVAVTFNTIRLQILTQREEIEVSKLLGATDAFVRRPFYYAGLLQGLVGGAIALALVYASLALLNRQIAPLAATYGSDFRLAFLGSDDAAAVLALAGALGWLGAHLSIGRHLLDI